MRVVDLFSGLGGWSQPFLDAGHEVFRVELEAKLPAELHADILTLTAADFPWRPDVLLASPPCEGFSVMNIGKNWYHDGTPKTDTARLALQLVDATLRLVRELEPTYWVMENPRDKLRALPIVAGLDRRTVTICRAYYDGRPPRRMKPTDLFSNRWPPSLVLEEPCKNGEPCHVAAPRGSKTGTQGFGDYWEKSLIPYPLAAAFRDACERNLAAQSPAVMTDQLDLWSAA